MVTFINNDMPIISYEIINLTFPAHTLHHSDINNTGCSPFTTTDHTYLFSINIKKHAKTFNPLLHKLPSVNQYQCIHASLCNHISSNNGLPKSGRCR